MESQLGVLQGLVHLLVLELVITRVIDYVLIIVSHHVVMVVRMGVKVHV